MSQSQVTSNYNFSMIDNEVIDLNLDPFTLSVYVVLLRHANRGSEIFPSIDTIGEKLSGLALSDDPDDPPKPLSRPTVSKALSRLERLHLIEITPRFLPNGGRTSNGYTILRVEKRTPVNVVGGGSQPDLQPPTNDVYSNKTPDSEIDSDSNKKKKGQPPQQTLSEESAAFWDMFGKRHQTIFGHPYNGPAVETNTQPTLRTLQALDAAERFDIVDRGLKAMAESGQVATVGSWTLYDSEIQRAIDDYAAQKKANQVIGMFTMNLNEALVRCGMPVMTGTYTQSQRQAIAAWGHMLDANDLEKTILLYGPTHPKDHQPFMINVKLNWVIETAKNNRLAAASGAVPAAKNGNGKGYNANNSYSGYGSARSSNNGNGRGQSGGQLSLDDFKQIARDLGQLPDV